jgi:hypothetical protein
MPESSINTRDRSKVLHDLKTPITSARLKLQLALRLLGQKTKGDPKIQKIEEILSSINEDFDRYIDMLDKVFTEHE